MVGVAVLTTYEMRRTRADGRIEESRDDFSSALPRSLCWAAACAALPFQTQKMERSAYTEKNKESKTNKMPGSLQRIGSDHPLVGLCPEIGWTAGHLLARGFSMFADALQSIFKAASSMASQIQAAVTD